MLYLFSFLFMLTVGMSTLFGFIPLGLYMDNNRNIKILVWNIKGINSQDKWDAIRAKISESACHILCLQETKREQFDMFYLKKFCQGILTDFFLPVIDASGGLIIIWNSSFFNASPVHANSYAITTKIDCFLNNSSFHLTNVYGPSASDQKLGFITWLINLDRSNFSEWILVGDFNLYRSGEDRNKPDGNANDMQMFNELIVDLDLSEIPFSGQRYT